MGSELYREEFVYKSHGKDDYVYNLVILPEIAGKVVVVITALSRNAGLSLASVYPGLAKQIYFKHLQRLKAVHIIWIEKVIQRTSDSVFFKVDLSWDEQLEAFDYPTGSLVVNKLSFI